MTIFELFSIVSEDSDVALRSLMRYRNSMLIVGKTGLLEAVMAELSEMEGGKLEEMLNRLIE